MKPFLHNNLKIIYINFNFYIISCNITLPISNLNILPLLLIHIICLPILQKTKFSNLFLSGAHCKTSISIWSMEGAVESGKITSNLILSKYKLQLCDYHKHQSNLLICLLKESDFLVKLVLIILISSVFILLI